MPEAYGIWKMKTVDVQINTFVVIFVWLPWFLLLRIVSSAGTDPPCEDFDTSGCLSNPGLCSIPDLSISTCPKSCNKCAFYCYHCDHPVSAVSRCTNVTACQGDKQCLYMHVTSSIDGHEEFTLKCVEPTVCNTKRMLQTRNVQMHCCTGNYCNKMQTPTTRATSITTTVLTTTTRTTSTTTTLLTTTVAAQDCNKDIIFIAEESQNIGNVGPAKQFVHDVISGLEIGVYNAMTALLLNKPDTIIWDLDGHYTKTEMINHLQILQKEAWPPNPDPLVGLTTYIRHANDVSFGNRHDKADVVILLTTGNTADHSGFWLASMSKGYILEKLHGLSNNVIVFGIGHHVQRSNLREIATDDEHFFLLNNVYELPSYAERAKRHICA